jgi:hypothetical protein
VHCTRTNLHSHSIGTHTICIASPVSTPLSHAFTGYWLGSSFGALAVRGGLNATTSIEVTTNANSYRGVALLAGGLYAANANTASSFQVHLIGGTTAVNVAPIASPAPAPTALPGLPSLLHTSTSVVFADGGLTMWVVDSGSGPNTITKYTRSTTALASSWVRATGYPKWGFNTTDGEQIATGGRGSVGWTDPGTGNFVIVAATAAGLVKYDTVTEDATLLAPACDNTQLRGEWGGGGGLSGRAGGLRHTWVL